MNAPDLAARLNLHRAGAEWRGQCPACGYGADAFALKVSAGRPRGWCASCGDRDGIAIVLARLEGGDAVRLPDARPAAPRLNPAERIAAALRIWDGAIPAAGTPAERYLIGRALPGLAASDALRWRPDVAHPTGGGTRYPALLALVVDVGGIPLAVHRTYLDRDGNKAAIVPVKAAKGLIAGGAIRLDAVASELVVGEGIETAASAGRLMGLPAWAAVSAGNLQRTLMLPPMVRSVVIAADPDQAGTAAAVAAAQRWRAEGRRVRIATPDCPPMDFNDLLQARARG